MPRQFVNLGYCTVGALLVAVGVVFFLSPNHIAAGGPAGIAIILFHMLGFSKGLTVFMINALLMGLGIRLLGTPFLLRTCYAVAAQSVFIELLNWLFKNPAITAAPLLNAIYGGALVGIGLGVVFRGEAASGGWTLVARIIASRFKFAIGKVVLFLDFCVIVASGFAFGDIEAALWAAIGVYVTGLIIDFVLTGERVSRLVHISTTHAEELNFVFSKRIQEDGSVVHCNTFDNNAGRQWMLLVVDRGRVDSLLHIIREVDANAHVVVMDAMEFFIGNDHKKAAA